MSKWEAWLFDNSNYGALAVELNAVQSAHRVTAKGAKATLLTDAGLFGNSKCMLCFECLYVNPKGNKVFVWSVGFLLAWGSLR